MKQKYIKNTEYEILTPNGWEDFDGIFKNKNVDKKSRKILFSDGSYIAATHDHRFFSNNTEIKTSNLKIGMKLDAKEKTKTIIDIEDVILKDTYEIYNAENHVILANDIYSHQCDELSFVSPNIAEDFWSAVQPTLSTGGSCIITSTPLNDDDKFAQLWFGAQDTFDEFGNDTGIGKNGFAAIKITWERHPDRDEKWAEAERRAQGEAKFRREHECEFVQMDDTLIDPLALASMGFMEPKYHMGSVKWYKEPEEGYLYTVSLDPSAGVGKDHAAIQVFEFPTMIQVAEWQHNKSSPRQQVEVLMQILFYIDEITNPEDSMENPDLYWTYECNGVGESIVQVIRDTGLENFPGILLNEPGKKGNKQFKRGFYTGTRNKNNACIRLKNLIETGKLKLNSKALVSQLKNFVSTGVSFKGKSGTADDLVMSMVLAVRMFDRLRDYEPEATEELTDAVDEGGVIPPLPSIFA